MEKGNGLKRIHANLVVCSKQHPDWLEQNITFVEIQFKFHILRMSVAAVSLVRILWTPYQMNETWM
jgi:hypothetical protein